MKKFISISTFLILWLISPAQHTFTKLWVQVVSQHNTPLAKATVELFRLPDTALLKIDLTDKNGSIAFNDLPAGEYRIRIQYSGFAPLLTAPIRLTDGIALPLQIIKIQPQERTLQNVTVVAQKPLLEIKPGKTIVNVEASITHAGATALETIEKLPGVTIDRNGAIVLKGKSGTLILIDGKPTYLDNTALSNLLSSMNASAISQIEIMEQPSAKYDASGNAGVINIKTKHIRQKGVYANLTTAHTQGRYYRNNNSAQINYRSGKVQVHANYSEINGHNFMRLYALRTYINSLGLEDKILEQASFIKNFSSSHSLQSGLEYFIHPKTTLGFTLNGNYWKRTSKGDNEALWMNRNQHRDSLIQTNSDNKNRQRNGSASLFIHHQFDSLREFTADLDVLKYRMEGEQSFYNRLTFPTTYAEAFQAQSPSQINIISARADYSQQLNNLKYEGGFKTSYIKTDNKAAYQYLDNNVWKEDLNKSNHFLYDETIQALYSSVQWEKQKWSLQGGLRYEMTNYQGKQLGNASQKDSSFSRHYNSFFPTTLVTYDVNDKHTFSFAAGRRIDRPPFQKLNPFQFIINKYTYQKGNPFFKPQYTWNLTFSHQFQNLLSTEISYSTTKDYFSQIFLSGENGVVFYSDGNVGSMRNLGASLTFQLSPADWWSFSAQAAVNHKNIEGQLWKTYKADITQFNISLNNQLRFENGWGAEITGFYNSRGQQDIQEIVDPAGQVSAGISKTLFKSKATVKGTFRDIFYTQAMQGVTYFENATELFKLTRDTRIATLSFTYRLGKPIKSSKQKESSAAEEIRRTGN